MRFIYVMREEDKMEMEKLGYTLVKENTKTNVYIFANKDTMSFACEDELQKANIPFILSDILTF